MRPQLSFNSLLRAFRWHRRWIAAVLVAVTVAAAVNQLGARIAGTVPVVTAARRLSGGSTLTAADLTISWLPAATVAEGSFDSTEPLVGQQLIAAVPRRGVLTGEDLLSGGLSVTPGKLALPIGFASAMTVSLLQVGSRIDVLGPAGTGQGYAVVATNLRVVAVPHAGDSGMLGTSGSELVMVEVDQVQAAAITAAASAASLSYALR